MVDILGGLKKFGTGVAQGVGVMDQEGNWDATGMVNGALGLPQQQQQQQQPRPAAKAAVVKNTPNQTTRTPGQPAANTNGISPYMKPGPAISGPANEAIAKKKRKAPGQVLGEFEQQTLGTNTVNNISKLEGMEGILDMAIGEGETPAKAQKALNDQIEDMEPVQAIEEAAVELGGDTEKEDGFDLQQFGRLLGSVQPGKRGGGRDHFSLAPTKGGGNYKSKGLWDQRITKEWMDIYNKPLYTPLHKVAGAMR